MTSSRRLAGRVLVLAALPGLSGCAAGVAREVETLAGGIRMGFESVAAQGYPDLSRIPAGPPVVPDQASFAAMARGLEADGEALAADPGASAVPDAAPALGEADSIATAMAADPRAATPGSDEAAADWAEAERARLDARIAALPPL